VESRWRAKAEAPEGERWRSFLFGVFSEFTLWQHAAGVLLHWIQTMDVFFLGLFRVPAREVGLYGTVLKVVNFSLLLPHALANLFSVWVGRRADSGEGRKRERGVAARMSLLIAGVGILQAAVLILLGEAIYRLLSHGRWSEAEVARMVGWTIWIASGAAVLGTGFVAMNWAMLRERMRALFLRVSLPAAALAFLIYGAAVRGSGLDGAARANLPVAAIFAALAILHARRRL
jgi:O-antigen/teichoic acid export membrane protein